MAAITPEQLADLFDRHAAGLTLYLRTWAASAEDIVQDTFVKLACQRRLPAQPAAWLFRTARNTAISAARQSKRRSDRESKSAKPEAWLCSSHDRMDAQAASLALNDLPDELREVVVARIWGALTFEEIAQLVDASLSVVYRNYHDGLALMQQKMGVSWNQTKT